MEALIRFKPCHDAQVSSPTVEPPSLNSILPFGSSIIHNQLCDALEEAVSCGTARVFILTVVLVLLVGCQCNEQGSLLRCPLGVSAGSSTLFGRSSWPATPPGPNFTCSQATKVFSIGARGTEEGADFGGTVALRGDHMSFSVHRGQPTRDEETRKSERDKPRRHCGAIMRALLSTTG